MRTEDGMDRKTEQGHRTGSGTNMEGLYHAQHTLVPGALAEGQRLGLDWGHGVCAGPTFSEFPPFLPHKHNGLCFFHLIRIHHSSYQHSKKHYCSPTHLSLPGPSRYGAGLWEVVYLQHLWAVGSQEKLTERWVERQSDVRECQSPWRAAFCLCPPRPCPQGRQH